MIMSHIKLDIDGMIDWKRMRMVLEFFKLKPEYELSSWARTRHGYHLNLFFLKALNDKELCFIQCAMGSDYARECLNWRRITKGSVWQKRNWNVLFKSKYIVDRNGKRSLASKEEPLDIRKLKEKLE